jgi:hypothetical protein
MARQLGLAPAKLADRGHSPRPLRPASRRTFS